jgi:hypothetical protein
LLCVLLALLAARLVVAAPFAAAEDAPAAAASTAGGASRWPYALPFLADAAIERGYVLPLPRGVSGIFYYVERDIEITDIRVGIDGAPLRSASKFLDLGSTSHVSVALARFDVWLLPFLDVYGLLGFVSNTTTTRGTATVPTLGPGVRMFNLSATTDLDGFVGGAGLTVAGGYRELFAMGDVNYSQTDIGFDDRFRALIGSIRVGWNGKIKEVPVRLWVGGMYWGTRSTAKASVDVPNVGRVSFEADQGPVNPLNATVGGSVTLFRRWDAFVEYGFNGKDVQAISAGLTFRF